MNTRCGFVEMEGFHRVKYVRLSSAQCLVMTLTGGDVPVYGNIPRRFTLGKEKHSLVLY